MRPSPEHPVSPCHLFYTALPQLQWPLGGAGVQAQEEEGGGSMCVASQGRSVHTPVSNLSPRLCKETQFTTGFPQLTLKIECFSLLVGPREEG